jgi:putative transcriptional regulator
VLNRIPELIGQKQIKEKRMISIADIADATGISRQTLHKWLRGEVDQARFDTIRELCVFFECEVGDLLYLDRSEEEAETHPN